MERPVLELHDRDTEFGYYATCNSCQHTVPLMIRRGDIYLTNFYTINTGKPVWLVEDFVMVSAFAGQVQLMHGCL